MLQSHWASLDDAVFSTEVDDLESRWRRVPVGGVDLPVIDVGEGEPLVFVPILEHLEFVYARQVQHFSQSRRVILYRRQEQRRRFASLADRAEELRRVLDALHIEQADLVGHGDAAMVLFEFALRYPQRCRSLIIIAQAADYQIAPHPFIWLLHEAFLRLPVERFLPAWFLRRIVVNYIVSSRPAPDSTGENSPEFSHTTASKQPDYLSCYLPRSLIEAQFKKIADWPSVYKFSVLPIIHNFDIRSRVSELSMPVLLINRADDALSPESKTRWLAHHLPTCAGYHVIPGRERFFMYAQAGEVNELMQAFLLHVSSFRI
jgi:pimeloyl-ACP methyl ester carboxylesterase